MGGSLSVVVPTLNEVARIGDRMGDLMATPGISEIVVVDGGSTDGTLDVLAARPGLRVIHASGGRGPQLNAGAAAAGGDVLWFVHADVTVPTDGPVLIARALEDRMVLGGAFHIETDPDGESGWPRQWLWLADLRSRYSPLPYGDQAIFSRRRAFERAGGFPALPLFEDLEFSRRLRRAGRIRILDAPVRVSGRRFMRHPLRSLALMNTLPWLYRVGVSPARLAAISGNAR